jgi:glycine cleavage system aminomethyltransferase T
MPEQFRYFDLSRICIGGQPVVISRTGFTNELGWEFYFGRFSGRYRELAFENPGRLGKWLPASTGDASTSSGAAE